MTDGVGSITFIGAGNVAWHLAKGFHDKGIRINRVYSRTASVAKGLAREVEAEFTTDLAKIGRISDLYIISVTDDVIPDILDKISFDNKLVVHTAGSLPMSVFEGKAENYGVFYPLQTFTKSRNFKLTNIPFCIEANDEKNRETLFQWAQLLSGNIRFVNSTDRKKLHLSAVIACNFTNYMYALADDYLKENDLPFDLLKPLISETADKIRELSPYKAQTGPAMRNNAKILGEHLHMLEDYPEIRMIYELLSGSIYNRYSGK